jgi:hypothetical protein
MASVSGHKSWNSLHRYTHIRHTGDEYGRKWMADRNGTAEISNQTLEDTDGSYGAQ